MSLTEFNKAYESIMNAELKPYYRAVRLAELMTRMEREYSIPLLKNEEWEQQNRKVIALYRKISISRREDL